MSARTWKERKGVVALLVVAAVAVWGGVLHTVISGVAPTEETVGVSPTSAPARDVLQSTPAGGGGGTFARASFVYAGDFRDPFVPPPLRGGPGGGGPDGEPADPGMTMDEALALGAEAVSEEVYEDEGVYEDEEPAPPDLRLVGVAGRTAVLERPDGTTVLVQDGDLVEEVEVLSVGDSYVAVDLYGYEYVLQLNR